MSPQARRILRDQIWDLLIEWRIRNRGLLDEIMLLIEGEECANESHI